MSEIFEGIKQGLEEALAYERGELELKTSFRSNDLLSREALILRVRRNLMPNVDVDGTVSVEDAERYFLNLLETEPAVDAVPVVYANWESIMDFGGGDCVGYCSNCHTQHKAQNATALKFEYRHCRWCGARMVGAK